MKTKRQERQEKRGAKERARRKKVLLRRNGNSSRVTVHTPVSFDGIVPTFINTRTAELGVKKPKKSKGFLERVFNSKKP